MSKHEIDITILPGGKIESEVKGIAGPSCDGVANWLTSLGKVLEHKKTPAWYQVITSKISNLIRK